MIRALIPGLWLNIETHGSADENRSPSIMDIAFTASAQFVLAGDRNSARAEHIVVLLHAKKAGRRFLLFKLAARNLPSPRVNTVAMTDNGTTR